MKKIVFIILFALIMILSAFSTREDMTPEYWVGTWMMEDEYDDGETVKRVWVIERDSPSSERGTLTTYKLNGEIDFEFTWEYYYDSVYILRFEDRQFMYYVFHIDEETRRLRRYTNSIDQFDLTRISDSQSGFPDNL